MKHARLAAWVLAIGLGAALPCTAQPFEDISGTWSGPVAMDARNIANVHSVGPLSMNIGANGEVDAAHANGCRFRGTVEKGLSANLYKLELSANGCRYESFNRSWTGHLARTDDGRMQLSLSVASRTAAQPEYLDASGILAR
jgi:hypothetical protein